MAKRKKGKPAKPDDVFEWGPIRIARFGKDIVWQSNWPEGEHEKWQQHIAEQYPQVVKDIDGLIAEIAELVCSLPPAKVLHRAWGEMSAAHLKIESEVEVGMDESISMRMLDYLQSVIVSHPRSEVQHDEISEENWQKLRTLVESLFRKLNFEYQIFRTAKNKIEEKDFNEDFEEFRFRAQVYWANVKGDRYQAHELAWLEDVFTPHSDILLELFGITGQQFVAEIDKILQSLTFGLGDAGIELHKFRDDTLNAFDEKVRENPALKSGDFGELLTQVIVEKGWEKRHDDIMGRLLGLDLVNVRKVTNLTEALLRELTWKPAEETKFFADGEYKGWPLRSWPIFERPFIEIDSQIYCFDIHSLFDHLYRTIEKIVCRLKPEYRNTWNEAQQKLSEELPFKYLGRLLPGAKFVRPVFYRWHTRPGAVKDWCEADGLVIYDDHLFIVEVRAGAFAQSPPATDFDTYIASLKNLILKPAAQGHRFFDYLNSADSVPICDRDHQQIGELRRADFRHIAICPVTLDPFTELAAQVQHLRKIGVDVGQSPVWAISVDDIRVFADIFDNPLIFLHFVEQRIRSFKSEIVQLDDELDHVGLYIAHNNYSLYAEERQADTGAKINFHGYRSEIDKFFTKRLIEKDAPSPIKQTTPDRILEIVKFLAGTEKPGRTRLSSYLLDLSGEWRDETAAAIDAEVAAQPERGRPKPFSSYGNVRTTFFCYVEGAVERNAEFALDHTRAVMLVVDDPDRLLVELSYSADGHLTDVNWQDVSLQGLSEIALGRLRPQAEKLRLARIASAKKVSGKIGRNDPCPCGSGKKYKKCCLNR